MKNDKRRITAKERVDAYSRFLFWPDESVLINKRCREYLIKMLGDHVKAAHKRHARKNVCFRPGDPSFKTAKFYKDNKIDADKS